jgi:Domain of unknown function (DUF4398)
MRLNYLFAFFPLIALSACAAAPLRPVEFALAREKIDAAEISFARQDPSSSVYLDLAVQELGHARAALSQNDAEAARGWAKQASADADLARSLALEAKARGEAQARSLALENKTQSEAEQAWEEMQRLEKLLNNPPSPASRSLPSTR